jgi:hypothetical protein
MPRNVQVPLPPMEVTPVDPCAGRVDHRSVARSMAVDQATELWRKAVADCDYTLDALEAVMGKGRAYIHKVLQGEKPMSLDFTTALPADVKGRHAQLSAEACGFIVVVPVRGDDAVKQLVGGLVGVLLGKVA